jgi:nucleoside-diphosphate-sugar epimerase
MIKAPEGGSVRVLVTGGYGCIGSWIAKNLVEQGREVWVYDLQEELKRLRQVMEPEQLDQVHFVPGDVADLPTLRAALERLQITHLIHLAGLQVPVCRANPLLGARVNVLGTLAVFEAVLAVRPQIERVVYASSAAVFGPPEDYALDQPHEALPDGQPLRPTTHYGVFKHCNEENARIYFQDQGLSSIGLRPWTVYGVGRDFGMTSEPTKAIKSAVIGRPYHVSYGGYQDLQYTDDVAKIFLRCLEVPFAGAGVFNLRGQVTSLPDFLRTLREVVPEAGKLITHGDRQLPIAYDLSDDRLRQLGAVPPATTLADGIRQTAERFRQLHHKGRLDLSDLPL